MSRTRIERRLSDLNVRLQDLRDELAISSEQLAQVTDEADDVRLRSIVSEAPLDGHLRRETAREAERLGRHVTKVRQSIATLEAQQDQLLDRLLAESANL